MLDIITAVIQALNRVVWGAPALLLILGVGLYFSFRTRFLQVRKLGFSLSTIWRKLREKPEPGGVSPFQAVCTALAATVGTGNIAGVAGAIAIGGPGAIFWMWVSAFFGMSTIYAEATLAQKYRTKKDGEVTGGPVYYIRAAFKGTFGKVLAGIFAVLIILALGFTGNMVQSNSIGAAFTEVFAARNIEVPAITFGLVLAVIIGFIFFGGVKRLASVVEKVVPIMAGIYIVGSLILICMNITALPGAIKMIFVGAFNPRAVLGAGAGIAVREAIRFGVARGLFSNEAGMGSTPHAHARAKVDNPHKQGLAAMISVFLDTFVILNLTVFSILTTGVLDSGKQGTALTQAAFTKAFGGFGDIFVAVCLFFFAFSTILGWHFFGEVNVKYLFGEKASKVYSLLVICFVVVGSTLKVDLVWNLSDFFNGLMVIPNAIALWALSGIVVKICREFGKNK